MKHAAGTFFLAFFSFVAGTHAQAHSGSQSKDTCAIDPRAIVSDACASYGTLDKLSETLNPFLEDVTQHSDFFSYYRLNLYNRECPYWDDSTAACGNIACAVNTVDEEDIPEIWRRSELSKLEGRKAEHPNKQKQRERDSQKPLQGDLGDDVDESCVVEYDDECDERDYCIPEDAGSPGKGDYVSLLDNRERFTGYAGDHAHSVWDSIYRENCFTKPTPEMPAMSNPLAPRVKGGLGGAGLGGAPVPEIPFQPDDSCMEKRVFHRIISGMHASISTHICHEYLDRTTGIWAPNVTCYTDRLHDHPDRVSNLYFNYALVSRAVAKLTPYLKAYTFCAGDPAEDAITKKKIMSLAETAGRFPGGFDENLMFRDPDMVELKADFRTRFRNVSRIMDCVGCDKCRLWGKLQTNGYGTALKVLFEFNGYSAPPYDSRPLKRTELVALVNTLARLGKSMQALKEFRVLMHTEDVASRPPSSGSSRQHGRFSTGASSATTGSGGYGGGAKAGGGSHHNSNASKGKGKSTGFAHAHEEPVRAKEVEPGQTGGDDDGTTIGKHSGGDSGEEEYDEPAPEEQLTDWEISVRELRVVYYTCIWVLKQWWSLPGNLWYVFLYQMHRLWSWWLGLYVEPPLAWEWNGLPFERDEL